jgi:hypothetical protein
LPDTGTNGDERMTGWWWRLLPIVVTSAALGVAGVVLAYGRNPSVVLEMDRDLPRRVASGFYPVEREGETTFAWTSRRADIKLAGLNRSTAWDCTIAVRGGRSSASTQPIVAVAVDGITAQSTTATNEFREVRVSAAPRSPVEGLTLSVTSSTTVVPGPADSRELGVQIDRVACHPPGFVAPPRIVAVHAAVAVAAFGAEKAQVGTSLGATLLATAAIAAGQALPLTAGVAPYVGLSGRMLWFGLWIAALSVAIVTALERWRAAPLSNHARFVLLFSGAALYLKLLGILHPSKLLVDALFHAHRLEWVLSGRYFFTQPMPSGVSFPYAIGLYVFAAPWSALTADYVMLLRVVVCAAEVVSGLLLYVLIAKAWCDRLAAAIAVVLFNVVALPYGLVGNANLTNAFGQSVALATLVVASVLPAGRWRVLPTSTFFVLCALAFLAHVSTFALLAVTLVALALIYRWRGDPALHRTAWIVMAVVIVAAVFAVGVYYGHFVDVYRTALRVRAEAPPPTAVVVPGEATLPLQARLANALMFTEIAVGWPTLGLALVGIWRVWSGGFRDRAVFLLGAWAVAYLTFLGVAVMRVDAPFQRYAAEFFGRVLLATYPAPVVLAAGGAAWAWRAGLAPRIVSALLVVCAIVIGVQHWEGWFM